MLFVSPSMLRLPLQRPAIFLSPHNRVARISPINLWTEYYRLT